MCGIIGYLGNSSACPLLLQGLKQLEYRGYDSAGVAIARSETIDLIKADGRINELVTKVGDSELSGTVGIGHTRWATHGGISVENAHPHKSLDGKLVLVHNGIIENYRELKAKYKFDCESETDSEVLAHLIGHYYQGKLAEAVTSALKEVNGSYGIVALHVDEPECMVAARMGSPLVIGVGGEYQSTKNEYFIASDATPLLKHTRNMIYLNDGEVVTIRPSGLSVNAPDNISLASRLEHLDWDVASAERGGFDTFMLKEIYEQPSVLMDAIRGRCCFETGEAHLGGINMTDAELMNVERITIIACGTAAYAGMLARPAFEELAGLPVDVELAGEFRYRNPLIDGKTLVLALSQSGETADTLAAVREAKRKGAHVRGIINVIGSTITRETGGGTYIHAGPEISVASTKAFTNTYAVLLLYALKLGRLRGLSSEEGRAVVRQLLELPQQMEQVLEKCDEITAIAKKFCHYKNFFYIARGIEYPIALEGSLKLKEVSYIHSEAYPAAEMKHGPIALLSEEFPVVGILSPDRVLNEKMHSNLQEAKSRKAPLMLVAPEGDNVAREISDYVITIPAAERYSYPLLANIALQLFAHHVATAMGRDIDRPRNLAKSVTVE